MKSNENREKMLALVEEWKQSGLSQRVFATEKGIKVHTFQYWITKNRRLNASQGSKSHINGGFVEVQASSRGSIFLRYPNGVEIHLTGNVSPAMIKSLAVL